MARIFSVLALFFLAGAPAVAQDMPLADLLIDGEGWKKVGGKPDKPKEVGLLQGTIERRGQGWLMGALSPDGQTVYNWQTGDRMISAGARAREPKGILLSDRFVPYCPLRQVRDREAVDVTGVTVDRDGRIYAVTDVGIQVFDPTGRLCGVMTAPPQGDWRWTGVLPTFEGDTLTLWIGDTKYARKLNTTGAK